MGAVLILYDVRLRVDDLVFAGRRCADTYSMYVDGSIHGIYPCAASVSACRLVVGGVEFAEWMVDSEEATAGDVAAAGMVRVGGEAVDRVVAALIGVATDIAAAGMVVIEIATGEIVAEMVMVEVAVDIVVPPDCKVRSTAMVAADEIVDAAVVEVGSVAIAARTVHSAATVVASVDTALSVVGTGRVAVATVSTSAARLGCCRAMAVDTVYRSVVV